LILFAATAVLALYPLHY